MKVTTTGLGVFYIALTALGIYRFYSPVPLADAWYGQIRWFLEIPQKGIISFLEPLNEHRLIFSRILYWLDNSFFDGTGKFLTACNVIFFILFFWVLVRSFKKIGTLSSKQNIWLFALVACFSTFSLFQRETITWSFNTHFVLAFLLPLLAFQSLQSLAVGSDQSFRYRHIWGYFIWGILAAGTMANGIFTLFIGTIALFVFVSKKLATLSFVIACIISITYIVGLSSSGDLSSKLAEINIFNLIQYFLLLLANPLFQFLPDNPILIILCQGFGLLILLVSIWILFRIFFSKNKNRKYIAFGLLIAFVLTGLVSVTLGRAHFGLWQAGMSRYATPVLTLYLCLAAIWLASGKWRKTSLIFIAFALVGGLISQLILATRDNVKMYTYSVASVAIELGVQDPIATKVLAVAGNDFDEITQSARKAKIGVFSYMPLNSFRNTIGSTSTYKAIPCEIEGLNIQYATSKWLKITGKLVTSSSMTSLQPSYLLIGNPSNVVNAIGAVSSSFLNKSAGFFTAYAPAANKSVLTDQNLNCSFVGG